ncbi:MAG TPA: ethanolamine ammonia-lyase subunit EutC [Mucilaginibacter sp.]|nr:ethanolamine ammonia-lyase subunit EutC [Mucilaginibacter sp.]
MKRDISKTDLSSQLRNFTTARIGIGRTGNSIPLKQSMEFKLAHAHARDAVYSMLDVDGLTAKSAIFGLPVFHLHSQATGRHKYLKRPDLGRLLDDESKEKLKGYSPADIVIIIADGLSAEAVNENSLGLLNLLIPKLTDANLNIAAICLVEQGRVAIGDDIGFSLGARFSLLLVGERPGLSAADSMGAYLTYNPRPTLTDESRNCVSNIRKHGLSYRLAADKIFYLIKEAFLRKISGIALKDNEGLLK